MCPYLRAMQKERKRNAEVRDGDRRLRTEYADPEADMDIPEMTKLKAHLQRRVERQMKNKWVQYATEYASEITLAGPTEKEMIRRYLEMTREAVEEMNRKDKAEKKKSYHKKRSEQL